MKFEENLKRLEEIVAKMESGKMNLEESIAAFEEGRKLVDACGADLESVKLKIQRVTKSGATEDLAL